MDDITKSKERLRIDTSNVIVARKELEDAIQAAQTAKGMADTAEKAYRDKLAQVMARDEQLARAEKSLDREKSELIMTKKQIEIDRLRVEKLAHDKDVDKELEKLRQQ